MRLIPRLAQALETRGVSEALLLVGGTIPEEDVKLLQGLGVHGVFPVGTFTQTMIDFIESRLQGA